MDTSTSTVAPTNAIASNSYASVVAANTSTGAVVPPVTKKSTAAAKSANPKKVAKPTPIQLGSIEPATFGKIDDELAANFAGRNYR